MRIFVDIKLALLPMALFWTLLGLATPLVALGTALPLAAALCAWRWRRGTLGLLEGGMLAVLAVLLLGTWLAPVAFATHEAAASLAGLGLVCLASVARRQPWTAGFAAAARPHQAGTPIFHAVNMAMSGLWGALFLLLGALRWMAAPQWASLALVGAGAILSILGPDRLARGLLARRLRPAPGTDWAPPDFAAARGEDDCDVAIIGAGLGGLTAGALLADAGLRVIVADQHVVPGGFCHDFLRKEWRDATPCLYRFAAGPHDFSGLWQGGPLHEVLLRLGLDRRITWRRVSHRYELAGQRIDLPADWRAYVAGLAARFPHQAAGIAALFDDIRTIYDAMYATGAGHGGIPGLPGTVAALLDFARAHPLAAAWLERPFAELLARHVDDPALIRLLTALSGYLADDAAGLRCADMVPIYGYYFHPGHYPVGGSGMLAEALAQAISARGGSVRLKTPVARIVTEAGAARGIVLGDGSEIRAHAVISNADARRTFLDLLDPAALPPSCAARMRAARPAASCFMLHLGLDCVPDLPVATHIEANGRGIGISHLSLIDPDAAPHGHATLGLITLLSHAEAQAWAPPPGMAEKAWRRSAEYQARKTALGDELLAAAARLIPDLAAHIVHRSEASPATYARYDWSSDGAIYGLAREFWQGGAKTPVPGLVLAGAATAGPGVEAVVISGARAAEALLPGLLARRPDATMMEQTETAA